jgi:transposase
MNKALDEVRAEETRRMKREGRDPVLKKSRWLLLKRCENLGDKQHFRLRDLLRYNLKTVRAYLLKRNVSATMGLQLARLGWQVSRMVLADHAFAHRAHEEDRRFRASKAWLMPILLLLLRRPLRRPISLPRLNDILTALCAQPSVWRPA